METQTIKASQTELLRAVNVSLACIKGNVSNPMFSSMHIAWGNGFVGVESCDAISGVLCRVPAEVVGRGDAYLNPQTLSEYLSTLGGGDVVLDLSQPGQVKIGSGKSRASIPTVDLQDYPTITSDAPEGAMQLEFQGFLAAMKWVSVAVAADESRPVLTGVLLRGSGDGVIQVVGSDGYRLSLARIVAGGDVPQGLLVPHRPLSGLLREWRQDSEGLSCWLDQKGGRVWFSAKDRVFYVRLIQGDFPPFEKILPSGAATTVRVDRDELSRAVKQIAMFARQSANIVQCEVSEKAVRLFTKEGVGGSAEVVIDASVTGDGVSIAFNYRYLLDYMKIAQGDEVVMTCNGPLAPVQFVDEQAERALHIIMPVKV